MQKYQIIKKMTSCDSSNSRLSKLNFCNKLSIMLYLCTTSKLWALRPNWLSDIVDKDVVLVSTVVENNDVLELHRKQGQVLNPV